MLNLTMEHEEISMEERMSKDFFGVQYVVTKDGLKSSNYTPSLIDRGWLRMGSEDNGFKFTMAEAKLVRPYFMPIRCDAKGFFIEYLEELSNVLYEEDEYITFAFSFHKKTKWREQAIEMYQSYLNGVDYPMGNKYFRHLQESILNVKNNILSNTSEREYSQDIEDKILDNGYSMNFIIQIYSDRCDELIDLVQSIFDQYAYYNGIKIGNCPKRNIHYFEDKNQIMSKQEILSLLSTDSAIASTEVSEKKSLSIVSSGSKLNVEILPEIEGNVPIKIDDTLECKLAEAMKRVGLIKQARLYNSSINSGSRLVVVQCDVPTGKNYSDVEKKKKDIRVALGVKSLGIEQGEAANTIKFSIPHNDHRIISLREMVLMEEWEKFREKNALSFVCGMDELDSPVFLSLRKLAHLLVAGTTGSGKSVFLNQMIYTLLSNHRPDELQMFLIDPKKIEFMDYEGFPQVQKVVTDMNEAGNICTSLVLEMEERYDKMSKLSCREIDDYNTKSKDKMPYIVFVVDEFADLMTVASKSIEESIMRLGQKARACGIHLIIATQRPSADILSGTIKANIQNAISFNLGSNRNYRTVFDESIPFDSLLGMGDGVARIERWKKDFQRFQSPTIHTNNDVVLDAIEKLKEYYSGLGSVEMIDTLDIVEEVSLIDELKMIIADTGETRVGELRKLMGIKSETIGELMSELTKEGWLMKHKSRSKGYELIIKQDELDKWKNKRI